MYKEEIQVLSYMETIDNKAQLNKCANFIREMSLQRKGKPCTVAYYMPFFNIEKFLAKKFDGRYNSI